jgi:pilus assembly protein CpaB
MDKKGIAFIVLALVMASLAAAGVYLYLKGTPAAEAQAPVTTPVIVASKDLTFGTTLKEEHLRVVDFPKSSVPVGSFASVDSVLSQTTKVFVVDGEPILASKLSSMGGGLSVRIPPEMRAMSLKVNEVTGVSGFVLPGDRVDVLVTIDNVAGLSNNAVTKTILQDVEVLASGVKTETKNNQNVTVQTVTVLVDPDGSEKMALAVDQGSVHLALRNPVDREVTEGATVDTRTVLGLAKEKKAVAPAPVRTTVTKKEPVPVDNTFTVIRDGKIMKQESPTPDKDKQD